MRTNARAWLREGQEADEGPDVEFLSFDSKKWRWSGVELYHLTPRGSRASIWRRGWTPAPTPSLRITLPAGTASSWTRASSRCKGNFLQIGDMINLDEPLAPLGWLPISDENGLLLIWPVYAPMC